MGQINNIQVGSHKIRYVTYPPESGKICFHALGNTENKDSGYIAEWNNSFIFNVSNGIYEVFHFDFIYEENEIEERDTMFSVKKNK